MERDIIPTHIRILIDELPIKSKKAIIDEYAFINNDNKSLRKKIRKLEKKVEVREFIIMLLALVFVVCVITINSLIQ